MRNLPHYPKKPTKYYVVMKQKPYEIQLSVYSYLEANSNKASIFIFEQINNIGEGYLSPFDLNYIYFPKKKEIHIARIRAA